MRSIRRAVALTILVGAGTAWVTPQASAQVKAADASRTPTRDVRPIPRYPNLKPRVVNAKLTSSELRMDDERTGRALVKFVDQAMTRVDASGTTLHSRTGQDIAVADDIVKGLGVKLVTAFPSKTEAQLQAIEDRARKLSGRMQPDLSGMMYVTGRRGDVEAAGLLLNELDCVEFVTLEDNYLGLTTEELDTLRQQGRAADRGASPGAFGGSPGDLDDDMGMLAGIGGLTQACCLPDDSCVTDEPDDCIAAGGVPGGEGTSCVANPNICVDPQACCFGDESCLDLTPGACADQGGELLGPDTICTGNPCVSVRPCCIIGNMPDCTLETKPDCDGMGGLWQSNETDCMDVDCAPETGACCQADGNCTDATTSAQCLTLGGTWQLSNTVCPPSGLCGACCITGETTLCRIWIEERCSNPETQTFQGEGTNCEGDDACVDCMVPDDPDCGDECTGSCFLAHFNVACEDQECCDTVCDLDPFCCEEQQQGWPTRGMPRWDAWCVQHAITMCDNPGDPGLICGNAAGSCLEAHEEPGCSDFNCCITVCDFDPGCCLTAWDTLCVAEAIEICGGSAITGRCDFTTGCVSGWLESTCVLYGGLWTQDELCPGESPDVAKNLTFSQGYLYEQSYVDPDYFPSQMVPQLPLARDEAGNLFLLDGFSGEGYSLQRLWELGEIINQLDPTAPNLTRGHTIRVGVIDESAFADWENPGGGITHEDLANKVIAEPNQTMIIVPGGNTLTGDYGTAHLGIIGARNDFNDGTADSRIGLSPVEAMDSERGCLGVAPDAELYFFPTASLEDGGRSIDAISSALAIFEPGDVLNFSWSQECGPISANLGFHTMFVMARDLGLSTCLSAGYSCCDTTNAPQAGIEDCDATVVGGCTPGTPGGIISYARDPQSNFCRGCAAGSEEVHVAAFSRFVATLGAPGLPPGLIGPYSRNEDTETYTISYFGTDAATAQVSGLTACLQGLTRQFYGIPLDTAQMRALISGIGFPQMGSAVDTGIPGNDADRPCRGDWDPTVPPNKCGQNPPPPPPSGLAGGPNTVFTDAYSAGEALLTVDWFDGGAPGNAATNIIIATGDHVYGNDYSIRGIDNNLFVATSEYRPAGSIPTGFDTRGLVQPAIVSDFVYISSGQMLDLVVLGSAPDDATALQMSLSMTTTAGDYFVIGYIYNYLTKRWQYMVFGRGEEALQSVPFTRVSQFIKPGTESDVLLRVWVLGFDGGFFGDGSSNPGGSPFNAQIDMIRLDSLNDFGEVIPPGGPL